MSAPRLTATDLAHWEGSLAVRPTSGALHALTREELGALVHDARLARELHELVNSAQIADFSRAVKLEAAHQVLRFGSADRQAKDPAAWFWLLGHLAARSLEHHKEAERLQALLDDEPDASSPYKQSVYTPHIARHRQKAAHHAITSAAVLAHWHASIVGQATAVRPGCPQSEDLADLVSGGFGCTA